MGRSPRLALCRVAAIALALAAVYTASADPLDAPDVTIAATPSTVRSGGSTRLTWKAWNATACTGTGGWNGSLGTGGSRPFGPLTRTTNFDLTCSGPGGSATQTVSVTVASPIPAIQLSIAPSTVSAGNSATLKWSASDAASCTASGGWAGVRSAIGSTSTGPVNADTTYTLSCSGPGGVAAQSATVSVTSLPPTLSLTASPSTVAKGATAKLNWSSANAASCVASGAWSGAKAVSGSLTTGALSAPATYTLTCTGVGGSAVQSQSISVGGASAPVVNLSSTPSTVKTGAASVLNWSARNATSCTASGAWSGAKSIQGSLATNTLTADATYVLTCIGTGGSAAQSTTVSVIPPPPALSLKASPAVVGKRNSATLEWVSSNATSCTASGAWSGPKPLHGSNTTPGLTEDSTFILTCAGPGGTTAQSTTVSLTAPAPTIALTAYPSTIDSGASTRLVWSSTNTTSCTGSGAWSGEKPVSGSQSTGALTATATYSLSCIGIGGTASQSQTVTVSSSLTPSVKLSAAPSTVKRGGTAMLSWSAANATQCMASGGWSGAKPTNGSESSGAINADQTYTLTCSGVVGKAAQSATVAVTAPAPTLNLTASPASVASGSSSTLNWSSANATACTGSGAWTGAKALAGSQSTGALKANATYALTCSGSGGSTAQSVTVVAAASAPLVNLSTSPSTVKMGTGSTLNWSASNATSCTASGAWSGPKATSGSQSTGALTANETYELTCTGTGGSASQSATVSVTGSPPTVALSAGPSTVASGGTSTLTWSSTNATSCSASGAWSGSKTAQGSQSTGVLAANATYTLSCSGTGGSASQSATVSVKPPAPTVSLQANPSTIKRGATSSLTWSSANATSCAASGGWSGSEGTLGAQTTAALSATTTFTLSCSGSGGSAAQSATVTVTAASAGSGAATLSWVAPTLNTDGTPLTTLTGYHIVYGTSANALTQSIAITGAAVTSYEITNLAPGTWYFAIKADSVGGAESAPSDVASTTI
jgi:trimeric autotransporter adhesin